MKRKNFNLNQCLIIFSIDNNQLKKHYSKSNWENGYADIQQVFEKHRYENIQGGVYLSECGVSQAHGVIALQEVTMKFEWFDKCLKNVQFYKVTENLNAQFIVDKISRDRQTLKKQFAKLKNELLKAGLSVEVTNEIVEQHALLIKKEIQKSHASVL